MLTALFLRTGSDSLLLNKNGRKLTALLFFCAIFLSFYNSQIRKAPSGIATDREALNGEYDVSSVFHDKILNTRSWDKVGKENLVEQSKPWMSKQVQALICSYLDSTQTVMLEYGGGGSTLFFSQYVKFLYTIESVGEFYHDLQKIYLRRVLKMFKCYIDHLMTHLILPQLRLRATGIYMR